MYVVGLGGREGVGGIGCFQKSCEKSKDQTSVQKSWQDTLLGVGEYLQMWTGSAEGKGQHADKLSAWYIHSIT